MSLHQIQRKDTEENLCKIFKERIMSESIPNLEKELEILKRISWEWNRKARHEAYQKINFISTVLWDKKTQVIVNSILEGTHKYLSVVK